MLGEVIARIRAALAKSSDARHALNQAGQSLDEANQYLTQALEGSYAPEAEQAVGMLAEARSSVDEAYRGVTEVENRVQSYLTSLDADTTSGPASNTSRPPSSPDPAHTPDPEPPTRERIEQLRAELPPPVVRSTGQKTHGRWLAPDGSAQSMISGRDGLSNQVNDALKTQGCPRLPARAADDVELKLAALMRDQGKTDPRMRHITVVINNRPCKGDLSCDELIPVILPEGYSLTVHAPNYRKRFTGGAKPWWR